MNKNQTKELIKIRNKQEAILQAFIDGDQIESHVIGLHSWSLENSPCWQWSKYNYRVYDKFRELKEAHAKGAVIQFKKWETWADTCGNNPTWSALNQYRIKPEEEIKLTLTVNGEAIHPSKLSQETWDNLRK